MPDAALTALSRHYDAMPPVRAMGVEVLDFDGEVLRLRAPLAANVNDKDCAFGGSLCGLMTLAGWGLASLRMGQAGYAPDVYVADSQVRYLAPLYADLVAEARLAEGQSWDGVVASFAERGRARVTLEACVRLPGGGLACSLTGRYAIMTPKPRAR